jgi:hypothetical protein
MLIDDQGSLHVPVVGRWIADSRFLLAVISCRTMDHSREEQVDYGASYEFISL